MQKWYNRLESHHIISMTFTLRLFLGINVSVPHIVGIIYHESTSLYLEKPCEYGAPNEESACIIGLSSINNGSAFGTHFSV